MTNPNWFADDAETTGTIPAAPAVDRIDCESCVCDPDRPGTIPAAPAVDPDPVKSPTAKLRAVATAVQSTLMPADDTPPLTAGPGPLPAELSNPAFEPVRIDDPAPLGYAIAEDDTGEVLHALACGCDRSDDRGVHDGYDFAELGAALEARVLERHLASQAGPAGRHVLVPAAVRHPVEAKVTAGARGTLAASLGVALGTAVLQNLDVLPSLFGGDRPWVGALVTVLGVALPPLVGLWRGYQAPHTPRCEL